MKSLTKKEVEELLSTGSFDVTFYKLNGDIRMMNCTRNFEYISKYSRNWVTPKGIRSPGVNQIIVWDNDKNAWRSFRLQAIISINKSSSSLDDIKSYHPVLNDDLRKELSSGIYLIKYWKINGELKTTVGTRDFKLAQIENSENNDSSFRKPRVIPDHQIIYWDFNADGFRSFRSQSLVSLTKITTDIKSGYNVNIMMTKNEVQKMLDDSICNITFIKRDGSIRDMTCTSNWSIVKRLTDSWYEFDGTKYNHLFLVWDIVKNDYRNVRFDSILTINKDNNY